MQCSVVSVLADLGKALKIQASLFFYVIYSTLSLMFNFSVRKICSTFVVGRLIIAAGLGQGQGDMGRVGVGGIYSTKWSPLYSERPTL